jgi:hypothetical protein
MWLIIKQNTHSGMEDSVSRFAAVENDKYLK